MDSIKNDYWKSNHGKKENRSSIQKNEINDTSCTELTIRKNFEKITVKDICEHAEISRNGFYRH